LDTDFLTGKLQIGTLTRDRSAIRFAYDPSWLQHPLSFAIDPDLSLGDGVFHPQPDQGNFRVFADSAPDRWGQMLMKRREAFSAKDEGRAPRTKQYVEIDLEQLFRRVAFNVAIGNRDDHLRNHGFILTSSGLNVELALEL
jgi:hypothetical protein